MDENEKIWFFDIQGDGSSLSKAKKFGPQYRNDIPKLLELWSTQKTEKPFSPNQSKLGTGQAWLTPIKDIIENDYILSANTYNPYSGEETTTHREPKEIFGEIEELDFKLVAQKKGLNKLLRG